jgi:hypothetical protein
MNERRTFEIQQCKHFEPYRFGTLRGHARFRRAARSGMLTGAEETA